MSKPIFTPEAPAPSAKSKRSLSTPTILAIGCAVILLLGLGTCAGGVLYCGKKVGSAGSSEWAEMRQVAGALQNDATAQAAYLAHPGLAASYPSLPDFLDATRPWRSELEPLPEQMPSLFSGKIGESSHYDNGTTHFVLTYHLSSGRLLVGTWHDKKLVDLQLVSKSAR